MSWTARLARILTLRCEGATELMSRGMDERLGVAERVALRGHLLVCRSCRRFARQVALVHAVVRGRAARGEEAVAGDEGLGEEARARIARALGEAAGDDRAEA